MYWIVCLLFAAPFLLYQYYKECGAKRAAAKKAEEERARGIREAAQEKARVEREAAQRLARKERLAVLLKKYRQASPPATLSHSSLG